MTIKNEFWHLKGSREIISSKELKELLDESSEITNVSYIPKDLQHKSGFTRNNFQGKTFKRVKFSHTLISGIVFRNCVFEGCLFVGTTIDNCEFHNCEFIRTNTYKISISNTYIDPGFFDKCLSPSEHQNLGVQLYQILLRNSQETDQIEFSRNAQFLFLRWKRFQVAYELRKLIKEREKGGFLQIFLISLEYLLRGIWEKLFGCGIQLWIYIRTVVITIIGSTIINYYFREQFGLERHSEPVSSWMEVFYYTSVSFTTLGYGDIVPSEPLGQLFSSVQTFFGFILLALLVSMLSRRVLP